MQRMRSLAVGMMIAMVLGGVGSRTRAGAAEIDLSRAVVVVPDGLSGPENKAVQLLVEEVRARAGVNWDVTIRWPSEPVPVLVVGPDRLLRAETSPVRPLLSSEPPQPAKSGKEGYRIR